MLLKLLVSVLATSTIAAPAVASGSIENCGNPTTKWDIESCSIRKNSDKFQTRCAPLKVLPNNATSYSDLKNVKGIIIMYHGYTACPDSTREAAASLQSQGFVVLAPLIVGHGVARGWNCSASKYACVGGLNDNTDSLPTKKEEYLDWLDWSLEVLKEEISLIPQSAKDPGFYIGSYGLSLGGALATASVSRPNSPVQKVMIANPFYSITDSDLDFKIKKCQQAPVADQDGLYSQPLFYLAAKVNPSIFAFLNPTTIDVQAVYKGYPDFINLVWQSFTTISDNLSSWMTEDEMNSPYGWGSVCEGIQVDRGGYCATRIKNLMAVHSIGTYSFGQSVNVPRKVEAFMMYSERDGFSRDALASTFVSNLNKQGGSASMCTYHISCDLNYLKGYDNTCGVPHALLSVAENKVINPGIYWEENMLDNIEGFFTGKMKGVQSTNTTADVCSSTKSPLLKSFESMGPSFLGYSSKRYAQ